MTRHSQRIQNATREGSPLEVLEGIRLVGEEAPSLPVDSLWHRAWGAEVRQVKARAKSGPSMLRRYVGGLKKVIG